MLICQRRTSKPPPAQLVWWRGLDGALATHGPGLHVHGGVQGAAGVGVQGAPGEEGLQLGPRRGAVTGPGGTHGLADVGGGLGRSDDSDGGVEHIPDQGCALVGRGPGGAEGGTVLPHTTVTMSAQFTGSEP